MKKTNFNFDYDYVPETIMALIALIISVVVIRYKEDIMERFSNFHIFQPFTHTNLNIIPHIHRSFNAPHYTRQNLLSGSIPKNSNTLLVGVAKYHSNTLSKYMLNQLILRTLLYYSKQFTILQIDYDNEKDIVSDLHNKYITYGIVSAPSLHAHNNDRGIKMLTPVSKEYIYGITKESSGIEKLEDLSGKIVGIPCDNWTTKHVASDLFSFLPSRIGAQICPIIGTTPTNQLINMLNKGEIDAFVFTGDFPSDNIRKAMRDPSMRPIYMVVEEGRSREFHQTYPYYRGEKLNVQLLTYYRKGVQTRSFFPSFGKYTDYTRGQPWMLTYSYPLLLVTHVGNKLALHDEMIPQVERTLYQGRDRGYKSFWNVAPSRHFNE